jgi:hypothetical protein
MWHSLPRSKTTGAHPDVAPLLIKGIRLQHLWNGIPIAENNLTGIVDTAAYSSAIPLHIAIKMQLPSIGRAKDVKGFDRSIKLPTYPKYRCQLFIPKRGWMTTTFIGCPREDVLLGRDIFDQMLLMVNWRSRGFGMIPAYILHAPLRLLFLDLRKVKDEAIHFP